MPVTHSELFHSWRIRSGVRAAAAAACGGGADGSRHCFWIAPVTCLKQGLAAILLRARRAAPGGPRRFREDQHGARHGPAGASDSAGIFFARARCWPASSTSLSYRKASGIPRAPVISAAATVTLVTASNGSHSGGRHPGHYALICRPAGGLHGGIKSLAESVSETCSNTYQEIALSNSNLCIFCQDWVRLMIDGY